jgi:UDP-N-acetylmuramyl tripeptide synthase
VASLADACRGPVLFYSVSDISCAVEQIEHAADARWCPACGREYTYSAVFYGHVGHWSCPGCGRARPAAAIEATRVEQRPDAPLGLSLSTPSGQFELSLPLMGLYNAYNALAAVSVGVALAVPAGAMQKGVASFTAAFGRQERMIVRGREVHTILAKNPAGLNQVLRAISAEKGPKNLLFLLNDDIADGRDVSWIWDVDFEMLAGQATLLMASGRRAADMALRLKYADIDAHPAIEEDTEAALEMALALTPEGERLYVIPTYTAMLKVRKLLARWGQRPPFWKEA